MVGKLPEFQMYEAHPSLAQTIHYGLALLDRNSTNLESTLRLCLAE